jgi:hypothetical protein
MTEHTLWMVMRNNPWDTLQVEAGPGQRHLMPFDLAVKGDWYPGTNGFFVVYPTKELAQENAHGAQVVPLVVRTPAGVEGGK